MVRHTSKTALLAGLGLAATLGFLGAGAGGAMAQDTSKAQGATAQDDDHSYLPPWMQQQQTGGANQSAGAQAQYANPTDDPARQKAWAQQQQQQKQRKRHYLPFDFSW
jgi:hypothetical protein